MAEDKLNLRKTTTRQGLQAGVSIRSSMPKLTRKILYWSNVGPIWHWARNEINYRVSLKEQDTYEQLLTKWPPVVICGTGGSGTRVFVSICERAGYYSGSQLNRAKDSLEIHAWVRKWLPEAIMSMRKRDSVALPRMRQELYLRMMRHRRGILSQSQPWVIKNPRLMLALPYLHSQLPKMRFIHVVRDGRDMAFSKNQQQLRIYGGHWLDKDLADAELPVRSMAFWAKTNLETAQYCQSKTAGNYLRIRFEDLCREPTTITAKILAFLNCDADVASVAGCVQPPESIGRWRDGDKSIYDKLFNYGSEALRFFGYSDR